MNGYFKLILSYIKKYLLRSIAIAFSMVLSISTIVGIETLANSAKVADIDRTRYEEGDFHVKYKDLSENQLKSLKSNKEIKQIGLSYYYDSNIDSDIPLNLVKVNKEYLKMFSSKLIKGKFPTDVNQIAMEKWVLDNFKLKAKLGQKITIKSYKKKRYETYTLVGIIKDRPVQKSVGVVEGFLTFNKELSSKAAAYIKFDEKLNIYKNINKIAKQCNIKADNISINSILIDTMDQDGKVDYNLIGIAVIIFLVSTIVICGIFNISILQRVSEYGILRALGSSSYQIFKLVLGELLILLIISTPMGICLGLFGAKMFSSVARELFTEGTVEIRNLVISPNILLFSILVNLVSILKLRTCKYSLNH